ncbi:putative F0F1-ATPase subunit [mine drainage metagenome]|uniref:Putative F0F1-ATPase subunit n=1 Tax=mine drainage metagenome TaxID=410659 RepID=T1CGW0_9ZZZZ
MSEQPQRPDDADDALVRQARLRNARQQRQLDDGKSSVTRHLAQIGMLGLIIVLPMLLGLFAGRWLDHLCGTGLMFTGALLILGLVLGSWSAWNWIKSA